MGTSWRPQLRAARDTLAQVDAGKDDSQALRSARALAGTAASESALSAQFEAQLLRLSGEQLQAISAHLEVSFASLRGHRAEAAAQLESATEDLLAELRAELAAHPGIASSRMLRYEERFAEDVRGAMRSYAERIEQLLLDLGEAAHAAVGAPAGGFLPMRASHVPPRPNLEDLGIADAARLHDELSKVAGRSIDAFRDRLTGQAEEAIETLEARVDRAVRCHAQGEPAVGQRADELARIAQRMHQLAETLDWMLLDER